MRKPVRAPSSSGVRRRALRWLGGHLDWHANTAFGPGNWLRRRRTRGIGQGLNFIRDQFFDLIQAGHRNRPAKLQIPGRRTHLRSLRAPLNDRIAGILATEGTVYNGLLTIQLHTRNSPSRSAFARAAASPEQNTPPSRAPRSRTKLRGRSGYRRGWYFGSSSGYGQPATIALAATRPQGFFNGLRNSARLRNSALRPTEAFPA